MAESKRFLAYEVLSDSNIEMQKAHLLCSEQEFKTTKRLRVKNIRFSGFLSMQNPWIKKVSNEF